MAKVVIIGGGIAGCTTAIELGKQNHKIVILEKDKDILRGTSARTPGRMGLGYHYFDLETAKFYMKNTIEFMKKYSDCFLGDDDNSYLRKGRYFVTKDSLIPLQELMASYDKMSLHFEVMCRKNQSNDIFGTYHLHRTMEPYEFQDDINVEKVEFAIETQELLLDWQKFEACLKKEMSSYNISIKNHFEVSDAKLDNKKFMLFSEKGEKDVADYVINCTWQNIDKINSKIGINTNLSDKACSKQTITSRLKLLAEIDLPESLIKRNSMFFCAGPHAMFSNMGNGIGRITYAPVTNFGTTTEIEMPEQFEIWLNQGLTAKEEIFYGQRIIAGVAKYIPAMSDAKLRKVMPGIVKSKGSVDLWDRNSPFHKRDYDGVEERLNGWVDNASMKLFYSLGNARKVSEIIAKQEKMKFDLNQK